MLKSILLASAIALAIVGNANAADPWTNEETSAGVKKVEYTRYAFDGRKINLQFMGTLNADCTQPEEYEASIITEPKHGVAELEPRTDFMNYAKDNPRAKCNETKYASLMLTYKAKDGYAGPDSVTVFEVFPSGLAREITFTLNVRAIKPSRSAETVPLPPVKVK